MHYLLKDIFDDYFDDYFDRDQDPQLITENVDFKTPHGMCIEIKKYSFPECASLSAYLNRTPIEDPRIVAMFWYHKNDNLYFYNVHIEEVVMVLQEKLDKIQHMKNMELVFNHFRYQPFSVGYYKSKSNFNSALQ